jgi:hypothetical protein
MSAPAIKVELGLNLGNNDPFAFRLDDAIKGVLDNTEFTIGGEKLFDISQRLVSVAVRRGKSQALDRIDAGIATITVDNSDRLFDPLYEDGLYFGQLIPRREVVISSKGFPVFNGFIDDFDIQYEPGKKSVVSIAVSDAFSVLANSSLDEVSPPSELSGARIERILNLPEVGWPEDRREIDTGNTLLLDADIQEGTGTLSYLQLIETSEFGTIFISRDGNLVFRERNSVPNVIDVVFANTEVDPLLTPVPFIDVNIVYGSENLYNRISLENDEVLPEVGFAEDFDSQFLYGVRSYDKSGLLVQDPEALQFLADFLLARFSEPQYRFETVTVSLDNIPAEKQDLVLDLEIGDIVQVKFLPSGVPPAIEQYCRVIGINNSWDNQSKNITFSLERLDFAIFILDDAVLGVLDDDRLAYE